MSAVYWKKLNYVYNVDANEFFPMNKQLIEVQAIMH